MKKAILALTIVVCLMAGYLLGNFFPINVFNSGKNGQPFNPFVNEEKGIEGEARLEVLLLTDNGRPLDNVEVDLAEEPGPPPVGGVSLSNKEGIAIFDVKPGNYFIFFNASNFPKNIEYPEPRAVEVLEDQVNQETITLQVIGEGEISDWLTYENKELGFRLEYPDYYSLINEDSNLVSFQNEEYSEYQSAGGEFSVLVHPNSSGQTLEEWYEENSTEALWATEEYEKEGKIFYNSSEAEGQLMEINNLEGLKFFLMGGYPVDWVIVLIKGESSIFEIRYARSLDVEKETFERILSTFQLANED